MLKENLVQLLKSGNFTVAYHDNQEGAIYQGRADNCNKLPEDDKVDNFALWDNEGYLPYIVRVLVEALGGKALST